MNDLASTTPDKGSPENALQYKREFWNDENLKFSRPWYRLEKVAQIITKIVGDKPCRLLDIGCGPATLGRVLPANIEYYGMDIAIHDPAPNLMEVDILENPIRFGDKQFDVVVASGVFEYLSDRQSKKFAEIAEILAPGGTFIVSYTNFGHRKRHIYHAFSNVQSPGDFRDDLTRYFSVDRIFPASHNWKHGHPGKKLLQAANLRFTPNIPLISPKLAVDYFYICSPRRSPRTAVR